MDGGGNGADDYSILFYPFRYCTCTGPPHCPCRADLNGAKKRKKNLTPHLLLYTVIVPFIRTIRRYTHAYILNIYASVLPWPYTTGDTFVYDAYGVQYLLFGDETGSTRRCRAYVRAEGAILSARPIVGLRVKSVTNPMINICSRLNNDGRTRTRNTYDTYTYIDIHTDDTILFVHIYIYCIAVRSFISLLMESRIDGKINNIIIRVHRGR